MHPAYFETRFRCEDATTLPKRFAILSAYATTGETWPDARNQQADAALHALLQSLDRHPIRVVGFSPTTDHAEPSWAVDLPFDQACDIGLQFAQDALYYVESGDLFLSHCDHRRSLIRVGTFQEKMAT